MATKVIVIGAGWYGIAAAKTYIEADPTIDLTILEAEASVGGTWCLRRVYSTLLAQQTYGVYEYSDLEIKPPGTENDENEFIPATKIQSHIEEYSRKYGLLERIRFNITVSQVERAADGQRWNVWTQGSPKPLCCDKLIVATGLTSKPNIPSLPTKKFTPPVFHTVEMGLRQEYLCSEKVSTVTVYGGGKSAIDCIHLCVQAGKKVQWVIRPDGKGNGVPPLVPGIIFGRNSNKLVASRIGSKMYPTLHSVGDFWYRFFHSGRNFLGYWLHWTYCNVLTKLMFGTIGYDKSRNMNLLKPEVTDRSFFWINVPPAIITRPEILDWIHLGESITVYRQGITSLADRSVVLDDGQALFTDAMVFATGYDIKCSIFSPEDAALLGFPTRHDNYPGDLAKKWDALEAAADKRVVELFPRLDKPPQFSEKAVLHTPFRLYRSIVSPELVSKNDRSIAFAGAIFSVSTAIASQVVSLWAVAWLSGELDLSDLTQDDMERDVALANAFARRRYLTIGRKFPYALFECLPMVDSMLKQLGVNPRRKRSHIRHLFEQHLPRDYRGLVGEWKVARQVRRSKKE